MQSYPLQNTLTTSDSYFIIPVDTKCAVQNTSIQIDVTNTSGTLQYKIERTLWPVQKCTYPTFNTPEATLNSQATWVAWIDPTNNSILANNNIVVKGIKVTLITADVDDKITITLVQQGVI